MAKGVGTWSAAYGLRMSVSEALSILDELGSEEPTRTVEPNEICAALGVLRAEFSGSEERKLVSFIVTCSEQLQEPPAAPGWAASYEREAWSIALLRALDQLPVTKHEARWVFNGVLASLFLKEAADFGAAFL